jgi:N-methylhydantoinase A
MDMRYRVAVDVGGTFTDIVVFDESKGTMAVGKTPSTGDPIEGVMAAVAQLNVDLRETAFFAHGTTVATNALITRDFPPAALVTTRGFRDVIEIRRGNKDELWDTYADVSPPYIRRRDRLEVTERTDAAGNVLIPLDEEDARRVAAVLRARDVQTIAVCFINAHIDGVNERRMADILREELPDAEVTLSSDVMREIFEYERFSTTVANAVLVPRVSSYVTRLDHRLADGGYPGEQLLLHSGGGVMTSQAARKLPVRLAASGLSAGTVAMRHIAGIAGSPNAIGLDMGGTSTDVSLVYRGEARMTKQWEVEFGHPICFPSVEVLTIGAGGGSLSWIDGAGSLRNGPQSAGARPGPACYGNGNEIPTNTDANLVLGRLGEGLLGGDMRLDRDKSVAAVAKHVAEPLDLSVLEAAEAIVRVANANMADAVRLISIRRGYDPREFALVVFGGAGPLHGADLAEDLDIPRVIVPPFPGITSALGCLLVDVRHDFSKTYFASVDDLDSAALEAELAQLDRTAVEELLAEGVAAESIQTQRLVEMRYAGQWRSLTVLADAPFGTARVLERFHAEHGREYSYRRDGYPVEIHGIGVRGIGVTPKPELPRHPLSPGSVPVVRSREVVFSSEEGPIETPIVNRDDLSAGTIVEGPAVIEQFDSTILVPPRRRAELDEWANVRIDL